MCCRFDIEGNQHSQHTACTVLWLSREEILVKKEYLLVSVDKIKGIAYKNDTSACKNQKNVCRSDVSKGKVTNQFDKNSDGLLSIHSQ